MVSTSTDISMGKQVLSLWIFTTMTGLFTWFVLSIWMSKSHKMVAFLFSMTFGGLCSHQFLSCGRQKILHKHQWMYWPNLSCWFRYSVGARMGQPQGGQWSLCVYHTLYILGRHHFQIHLLENILLESPGPVLLWWSPQSQISDQTKLATVVSVKNLYQDH